MRCISLPCCPLFPSLGRASSGAGNGGSPRTRAPKAPCPCVHPTGEHPPCVGTFFGMHPVCQPHLLHARCQCARGDVPAPCPGCPMDVPGAEIPPHHLRVSVGAIAACGPPGTHMCLSGDPSAAAGSQHPFAGCWVRCRSEERHREAVIGAVKMLSVSSLSIQHRLGETRRIPGSEESVVVVSLLFVIPSVVFCCCWGPKSPKITASANCQGEEEAPGDKRMGELVKPNPSCCGYEAFQY